MGIGECTPGLTCDEDTWLVFIVVGGRQGRLLSGRGGSIHPSGGVACSEREAAAEAWEELGEEHPHSGICGRREINI